MMDSENRKDDFEPPSKRMLLSSDCQEPVLTSNLPNELHFGGGSESSSGHSTPDHRQDSIVDHASDDSLDDLSELSNLSGLEEADETIWRPITGAILWVQRQMALGVDPRKVLKEMVDEEMEIPPEMNSQQIWNAIISMLVEPKPRKKLPEFNTLDDAVHLLRTCKKIVILTGAGVSVSCGIPDFRSKDGIYARLSKDFPDLPDPQSMFDINYFKRDQRPFFKFAKEIYPGQFEPSRCHKFIKLLETHGKLLRNYTQNIDTLEKVAGIERAIECHGSFATATCMVCGHNVDADVIREDIFNQRIPRCPRCSPDEEYAVMKPDIVFFGESLPQKFHRQMATDKNELDLLIVVGSSLKVRPVALIPFSIPEHVPQILINREPLNRHLVFDVELLGNCDDIISELCKRLGEGWDHLSQTGPMAKEVLESDLPPLCDPPLPAPLVLKVLGREEVVEHSADSGLGDLELVGCLGTVSGESVPAAVVPLTIDSGQRASMDIDGIQRLSSCDNGAESSTTHEAQHERLDYLSSIHHDSADLPVCIGSANKVLSQNTEKSNTEKFCKRDCLRCRHEQMQNGMAHCTCSFSDKTSDLPMSSTGCSYHVDKLSETRHSSKSNLSSDGQIRPHRHRSVHSEGERDKIDLEREAHKDNAHCSHTDTIEEMRQMWVPRRHHNLSSRINGNQCIFVPPNRYIFTGAEVFSDDDSDDSDYDLSTPPHSPSSSPHSTASRSSPSRSPDDLTKNNAQESNENDSF